MMDSFKTLYARAPLIALTTGAALLVMSNLGTRTYQNMGLYTFVDMVIFPLWLVFILAAPVALFNLVRAYGKQTYRFITDRIFSNENRSLAGAVLTRTAHSTATTAQLSVRKSGAAMSNAISALPKLPPLPEGVTSVTPSDIVNLTLRLLASLVLTLLPLFAFILCIAILEHLGPRISDTKHMVRVGFILSLPFVFLVGVMLKTLFDLPRKFTYSPDFLVRLGKWVMWSWPVLYLTMLATMIILIPFSGGWSIVGILSFTVQYFGYFLALFPIGGAFMLIGRYQQRKQGPPAPPSPKPDPRWMDDPAWTEMP